MDPIYKKPISRNVINAGRAVDKASCNKANPVHGNKEKKPINKGWMCVHYLGKIFVQIPVYAVGTALAAIETIASIALFPISCLFKGATFLFTKEGSKAHTNTTNWVVHHKEHIKESGLTILAGIACIFCTLFHAREPIFK